jgi:hypothetical protein
MGYNKNENNYNKLLNSFFYFWNLFFIILKIINMKKIWQMKL